MLTDEQRLEHIMVSDGGCCPQCKEGDIEGGSYEYGGEIIWQKVTCIKCECEWVDTYSLSDVQEAAGIDVVEGPPSATARQLRCALDKLLGVFDELKSNGEDWDSDDRVANARKTLAMGCTEGGGA